MCWHRVRALQMWSGTCGSSLGFVLPGPDQGSQRDSITEVKHVKACIQTNKHVRTQTNPMRRVGVFFVSFGCQCVDVCQFSLVEEKG